MCILMCHYCIFPHYFFTGNIFIKNVISKLWVPVEKVICSYCAKMLNVEIAANELLISNSSVKYVASGIFQMAWHYQCTVLRLNSNFNYFKKTYNTV